MSKLSIPAAGSPIVLKQNELQIPDNPIIPFIEGDGIGPDIWHASKMVFDAAVEKVYGSSKKIAWMEIYAGEKAKALYGEWLPEETIEAIKKYFIAIKGPLTTPIGGGFRSLNVTLRQVLDLYACIRPVKFFKGVPSPVKHPEKMDLIIYRENTEDVYSGIEWEPGSASARKLISLLNKDFGTKILSDSGVGIKPISETASKNLLRKAIEYLLKSDRESLTLVHKGNIMKFTEGAFKDWGYELAEKEYPGKFIREDDLWANYGGKIPAGKKVIKDRIADNMFQQILTRTDEYGLLATLNLNGDYLSDACAAQVGGLGMAPGANMGHIHGLFEATHGTAPKYAGLNKVNPSSLILSGVMMFEYMNWPEVGKLIENAMEKAILNKQVTYDLARMMAGNVKALKTSQYAEAIISHF